MNTPDRIDALLSDLKPAVPPTSTLPDQAFRNYAQQAKQPAAGFWRSWSRWFEPALVGGFALIFIVWAFVRVFGG